MARHTWSFTRFGAWHFSELDTYVYVLVTHTCMCQWRIHVCVNKTLPCFPTKPCIQFKNQIHGKASISMRNKPMKFGSNPTTFEKMWHIRVCVNLEVQSLTLGNSQIKITSFGGPYEALTQMRMGCDTYAYVSNLTQLRMGGFHTLKLVIDHIHLCAVVRGTCPCFLVRKCVTDREI